LAYKGNAITYFPENQLWHGLIGISPLDTIA